MANGPELFKHDIPPLPTFTDKLHTLLRSRTLSWDDKWWRLVNTETRNYFVSKNLNMSNPNDYAKICEAIQKKYPKIPLLPKGIFSKKLSENFKSFRKTQKKKVNRNNICIEEDNEEEESRDEEDRREEEEDRKHDEETRQDQESKEEARDEEEIEEKENRNEKESEEDKLDEEVQLYDDTIGVQVPDYSKLILSNVITGSIGERKASPDQRQLQAPINATVSVLNVSLCVSTPKRSNTEMMITCNISNIIVPDDIAKLNVGYSPGIGSHKSLDGELDDSPPTDDQSLPSNCNMIDKVFKEHHFPDLSLIEFGSDTATEIHNITHVNAYLTPVLKRQNRQIPLDQRIGVKKFQELADSIFGDKELDEKTLELFRETYDHRTLNLWNNTWANFKAMYPYLNNCQLMQLEGELLYGEVQYTAMKNNLEILIKAVQSLYPALSLPSAVYNFFLQLNSESELVKIFRDELRFNRYLDNCIEENALCILLVQEEIKDIAVVSCGFLLRPASIFEALLLQLVIHHVLEKKFPARTTCELQFLEEFVIGSVTSTHPCVNDIMSSLGEASTMDTPSSLQSHLDGVQFDNCLSIN